MASPNVGPSEMRGAADATATMERWQEFFHLSDPFTPEKKRLLAIAKLTQIALVQYMRLRGGLYPNESFKQEKYQGLAFYTLNVDDDIGAALNSTIRKAGDFIAARALKKLCFQIFSNAANPSEIDEEIIFHFYYGDESRVQIELGNEESVTLDMSDCSFARFLESFGNIVGAIRNFCNYFNPLPPNAQKRFRTSFCKRLPENFATGPFDPVTNRVQYAPNIDTRAIGQAVLPGVGFMAVLRTCFLRDDAEFVQNRQNQIDRAYNGIFGGGGDQPEEAARQVSPDQMEGARRHQESGEDAFYQQDAFEEAEVSAHDQSFASEDAGSVTSTEAVLPEYQSQRRTRRSNGGGSRDSQ